MPNPRPSGPKRGCDENVCQDRGFVLASNSGGNAILFRYPYPALLGLVAILSACSSNTGPQLPQADFYVNAGQQFGMRVGDTAGIQTSSTIVLVRFNGVLNDSRCPVDAECVQAGSAICQLTVQTALNIHDISLQVPPSGTVEQIVDELTVRAIGLRPDAQTGVTIDPLNYLLGLQVFETSSLPLPQ